MQVRSEGEGLMGCVRSIWKASHQEPQGQREELMSELIAWQTVVGLTAFYLQEPDAGL